MTRKRQKRRKTPKIKLDTRTPKEFAAVVTLGDVKRSPNACDCGPVLRSVKPVTRITLGGIKKHNFGKHCVEHKKNRELVRCFRSKRLAEKVARGFGPGFRVVSG